MKKKKNLDIPKSKEEVEKENLKANKIKKILYLILVIIVPIIFVAYDIYLVTKASAVGDIVYDNFKGVLVFLGVYFILLMIHLDLYTRDRKIMFIALLIVEFFFVIYICKARNASINNILSMTEMALFATPFITGVVQCASIKLPKKNKKD